MKKSQNSLLLLTLVFFLIFVGCSKKEVPTNNPGVANKAAVVINDNVHIRENPSADSKSLLKLERGNLVKILSKKVVGNEEWSYIEPVCFSYPPQSGWVLSKDYTTDKNKITPNQGFIDSKNVYTKPASNQAFIREKLSSAVRITRRENGWAYCAFPAGSEAGWVKESDLSYEFPGYEFPE